MKQILILITIIFFPIDLFSQEECALFHDQGVTLEKARPSEPINLYEKYIPTEPRKIGLTIHIVRDDGGTGGIFLQDVTNAVIYLNNVFVGAKIKFIVDNIKYINSNYYYCIDDTTEARKLMNHDVVYNTLNIYFVPCVNAGFTGAAKLPGTSMILLNSAATTSTLPHEIGHNLWLYHTHETKFGRENIGDIDDPVPLSEDIPTCPPNCNIAGDLICDTPADAEPLLFLSGCKYRWDVKAFDNCGRTDYKPDFLNFMSYNTPNCRNRFTRQQVGRMHWALETHNDLRPLIEVHTIVSNLVDDMNIAGSSLTINNTNYFSGQPAPLLDGKEYYGRTNHERFENFSGGRTIKHNNWDNNKNQFYLLEKFQVKKERPKRDAIFLDGNSVTIKNELIDAPSLNVGSVEFRDPWYLHDAAGNQHNRFDSFPSPYIPTGAYNKNTGGVFLNQRVQDGVYYTVRVPLSQWIGNFDLNF